MSTIRELQAEIHALAKEKGWYDGGARQPLEYHMLFVSEIAEATEAVRNGDPAVFVRRHHALEGIIKVEPGQRWWATDMKPEGEAVELADAVIRIMDYFGSKGWDLQSVIELKHEFNKTRSYRHGGKTV